MLAALRHVGVTLPVLAAPMAGGPTTPELVVAAAGAGSMGFIAGGYKTADALGDQVRAVRAEVDAFGVNLFVPNPLPVDPSAYAAYRDRVRVDAARLGATVPETPVEDDDHWRDKIELLVGDPVPVVSFTFGIPDPTVVRALHDVGSFLIQTVTSVQEAAQAADAGVDGLAVQGSDAGGHSGTFTPSAMPPTRSLADLVSELAARGTLPIIAAGGLDRAARVAAIMECGADAVALGTALLLTPEAGTSEAHRAALRRPDGGPTVMTRVFTGRPARGVRNAFVDAHQAHAPAGYPALHHLTSPMRRAAAAANDPDYINLWAGVRYRAASERPAAAILDDLAATT